MILIPQKTSGVLQRLVEDNATGHWSNLHHTSDFQLVKSSTSCCRTRPLLGWNLLIALIKRTLRMFTFKSKDNNSASKSQYYNLWYQVLELMCNHLNWVPYLVNEVFVISRFDILINHAYNFVFKLEIKGMRGFY
jgi:hypothetical protein